MTESIAIALLGLLGVVSTALSGVVIAMLTRQHSWVRRVKEQVENDHQDPQGNQINLRDNIDSNQANVMGALNGIRRDVGRLDSRDFERGRELSSIRDSITKLADRDEEITLKVEKALTDLGVLEDTVNPKKETPK